MTDTQDQNIQERLVDLMQRVRETFLSTQPIDGGEADELLAEKILNHRHFRAARSDLLSYLDRAFPHP